MLTNFSLWDNFFFVVLIQLTAYIGILIVSKKIKTSQVSLIIAMSAGLLFGALYDLIVGYSINIFTYYIDYDWKFFLLNSMLSYGLAIATAAAFPPIFTMRDRRISPSLAACLAIAAVAGAAVVVALATRPILRVFSAGSAILAVGEIAALWLGHRGPIAALVSGQPSCIGRLWLWAAAIGLVYETANFIFPVWRWSLLETHSIQTTELLIVGFGYVVLFHPLVFSWQVILKRTGSSPEAA